MTRQLNNYLEIHASMLKITCNQALFSFRSVKHSSGMGETKNRAWYNSSKERLPPTFLIDWHSVKRPIKISSVCTTLGRQIPQRQFAKRHANVGKNKKITGYDINYLLGTSAQIYRIANLKVPLLYMVALSELKLNENSEHDEVVMY